MFPFLFLQTNNDYRGSTKIKDWPRKFRNREDNLCFQSTRITPTVVYP